MDEKGAESLYEGKSPAERLALLGKLFDQYTGTIIPDEELQAIGYVRVASDGGFRYTRAELLAEEQERPISEIHTKPSPFNPFSINLEINRRGFRSIQYEETYLLRLKLVEVDETLSPAWCYENQSFNITKTQELEHLYALFDDIEDRVEEIMPDFPNIEFIISRLLHFPVPTMDRDNLSFDADQILSEYTDLDTLGIKSGRSEQMYNDLERFGGHYGDAQYFRDKFRSALSSDIETVLYDCDDEERTEFREFFDRHNIKTHADFIKYALSAYLRNGGLSEIADLVDATNDLLSVPGSLNNTKIPGSEREREIQAEIGRTDKESEDGRGKLLKLNEERKAIRARRKKLEQLRTRVLTYLDIPRVYAQLCKQNIKEAQKFLVSGSREMSQSRITFDPDYDKELDENPGEVSGDCTDGSPLPFRERNDTHNIKVFMGTGDKRKHIGNIYLLETANLVNRSEKVWHLDAIQIPNSSIDWGEFVREMVSGLSEQAKAMGVSMITVNGRRQELISNYDYIQEAVKEFWEKTSQQRANIYIPIVNGGGNSSFQGDGEDLVLWRDQ